MWEYDVPSGAISDETIEELEVDVPLFCQPGEADACTDVEVSFENVAIPR